MMQYIRSLFPSIRRDEDGASAVEYGLLVAGIAALVVAIVFLLGGVITEAFQDTCDTISAEADDIEAECSDTAPAGG